MTATAWERDRQREREENLYTQMRGRLLNYNIKKTKQNYTTNYVKEPMH